MDAAPPEEARDPRTRPKGKDAKMIAPKTLTSPARLGLALALLALLIPAAGKASAADPLRWKFTKGKSYSYVVTQQLKNKAEVGGQSIDSNTVQKMTMLWEVKDVDPKGVAAMDQTIVRVEMSVESPQAKVTVDTDSKDEAQGPAAQLKTVFAALVNKPIHVKMTPRGEITDVTIDPQMLEGFKAFSGGPMGEMFSEKGLKEMTGQATLVLPEKALSKGDTWDATKRIEMPLGTMVMKNAYTLDDPAGKISAKVEVAIEPKPNAPFEIKIASQDVKGTYDFDNAAGTLKASAVTQKMQLKVNVQNMEIFQNLETNVTMTLGDAKK